MNALAGAPILPETRALIPEAGRLPAPDGRGKMSKSAGTALPLSAAPDRISAFVRSMHTDPGHLRVSDPGRVEGNVVFAYLDAFDPDRAEVERLKVYKKSVETDPVMQEKLAREEFGMVKGDKEILYRFLEK